MTLVELGLLVVGLATLLAGADLLVRGASRLATALGISPLVVGLTVVSFGTSSPELAIAIQASVADHGELGLGNVVGSNIFNVLFILGLSALVTPLVVDRQLVRREVPIMLGVTVTAFAMCLDGAVGRVEGLVLVAAGLGYTAWSVVRSRRETARDRGAPPPEARTGRRIAIDAVFVVAGLALLVLGARWLVAGAVVLARWAGLSDLVIGLTVIAAGTSLPEVATSVLAAARGQRDLAVGNVVGSNIFNLLFVLGAAASIGPTGVPASPAAIRFDVPVMLAISIACLPIFFTGWRIARWEGALFLAYYAAYLAYVILDAADHDAIGGFSTVVVYFALPLTTVTLAVIVIRQLRGARAPRTGEAMR